MQFLLSLCLCATVVNGIAVAAEPTPELYRKHCAECHGAERFGLMGPALLPENLSRLKKDAAVAMIRDSRPAVQMPPFKDVLKPEEIRQLADCALSSRTVAVAATRRPSRSNANSLKVVALSIDSDSSPDIDSGRPR